MIVFIFLSLPFCNIISASNTETDNLYNDHGQINSLKKPNIKTEKYNAYVKKQNDLSRGLENMTKVKTPSPLYVGKISQDDQLPNYKNPPKLKAKDYKEYLRLQRRNLNELDHISKDNHYSDKSSSQNDNKLSSEFLEPHKLKPKDIQNYLKSQKKSSDELQNINALGN